MHPGWTLERAPGQDVFMTYSPRLAADLSGFSLDTLRYYERVGLLYGIERTTGGQRVFSDDDLEWLSVLRCLRDTGMPIAAMRRYASKRSTCTTRLAGTNVTSRETPERRGRPWRVRRR
jgi:DNA-binding transcriptional MerR regulator